MGKGGCPGLRERQQKVTSNMRALLPFVEMSLISMLRTDQGESWQPAASVHSKFLSHVCIMEIDF